MNNKFKRAISSILAFVMVISVLTVMNITAYASGTTVYTIQATALASGASNGSYFDMADTTSTGAVVTTDTPSSSNRKLYWIKGGSSDAIGTLSNTSITVDGTSYTCSNYVGNAGNNAVGALAVYADKGDTITAYFNTPSSNGQSVIAIGTSITSRKVTNTVVTYPADAATNNTTTDNGSTGLTISYTTESAGVYYIGATTKRALFYAVTVEAGEGGSSTAKDNYTLSGTVNGYEGTFTVADEDGNKYEATAADGTYTFTASVESGSNAPYETGDSFTVTAPDGYTASPTSVSITNASGYTYALDAITFTQNPSITISGTVTSDVTLPSTAKVALTIGEDVTTAGIDNGTFTFEDVTQGQGSATVSITGADRYTTSSETINIGTEDITTIALTASLNITGTVTPTNETNEPSLKYTFTNYSGELDVSADRSLSTPYYYTNGGYTDNIMAKLDKTNGLDLYDNDSSATLYVNVPMPYTVATGTVTVETTYYTLKNSGNWNIMTLYDSDNDEIAALRSTSSTKYLVGELEGDSSVDDLTIDASGNPLTEHSANTAYAIKMVIDYDNNTVATYVDDVLINTATSTNGLSGLSYINFRTASSAREFYIKDLSVTVSASVVYDDATSTVTGLDGTVYYVIPVSTTQQANYQYYKLYETDAETNSVTGDTVYDGITVDGKSFAASTFGNTYVVAFIVSSTSGSIDKSSLSSKYTMYYEPIDSSAGEEE